jgi:hypothetical protein
VTGGQPNLPDPFKPYIEDRLAAGGLERCRPDP